MINANIARGELRKIYNALECLRTAIVKHEGPNSLFMYELVPSGLTKWGTSTITKEDLEGGIKAVALELFEYIKPREVKNSPLEHCGRLLEVEG